MNSDISTSKIEKENDIERYEIRPVQLHNKQFVSLPNAYIISKDGIITLSIDKPVILNYELYAELSD